MKIRRIRCGTRQCTGFIDTQVSTVAKTADGNWQFHCAVCQFWSLASSEGMVKATSREQFDLEHLPNKLRLAHTPTHGPSGGV